jgi:intein/homing endonuclease
VKRDKDRPHSAVNALLFLLKANCFYFILVERIIAILVFEVSEHVKQEEGRERF